MSGRHWQPAAAAASVVRLIRYPSLGATTGKPGADALAMTLAALDATREVWRAALRRGRHHRPHTAPRRPSLGLMRSAFGHRRLSRFLTVPDERRSRSLAIRGVMSQAQRA